MAKRNSLIGRFFSLFSRRSRTRGARSFEAGREPETTLVKRPPLYELQDIPTEVIVPPRQPVVLVQIERRRTAGNPKC